MEEIIFVRFIKIQIYYTLEDMMRLQPTYSLKKLVFFSLITICTVSFFKIYAADAPKPAVRPKSVKEFVARVEKAYASVITLKAHFEQISISTMGPKKLSGTIYLKKPSKMRWEYEKPRKNLFVIDGTWLWIDQFDDDEEPTVMKKPVTSSALPEQVRFIFGQGKLDDSFIPSYLDDAKVGQPGNVMLKLVPKKSNAKFKYLVFGIDPVTFQVKETILYDLQNGSNHLIFEKMELNPKSGMDDKLFQYIPAKNVKVIEQ